MKKIFLGLACFFLVTVAGLVVVVECSAAKERHFTGRLETIVPDRLEGWHVENLPLAATEGALANVNKILRSDDIVQRLFIRGNLQVIVYAAYWNPGKVTTLDAGAHNPDSCWVNAGMKRTERLYSQNADIGGDLLPFEYGAYQPPGGYTQHVLFWHLVQGVPQNYAEQKEGWRNGLLGRLERLPLAIEDIRRYGINQKREQLFIRISANRPLDMLKWDPSFRELLRAVSPLGIYKTTQWGRPAPEAPPAR